MSAQSSDMPIMAIDVATAPPCSSLGIATRLSLEALRLRESGRRNATLQASEAGQRVYRRIGFETMARYRTFGLPAKEAPAS